MKLTVVVTVYNESLILSELIQRLKKTCKQYQPFEIICVNDCSTDNSLEVLMKEKNGCPELKIINFEKNCGKSNGLDACFKEAKGDIIVTFDADLQELPEEIPLLIGALDDVDAVFGWRHERQDTFSKRFASRFANYFRRVFLNDKARDSGCPFKAFKRPILEKIIMYKGMHRFFPALVYMCGGTFREVKITHQNRETGKSKYSTFGRAFPAFFDLLAVIWMRKRRLTYKVKNVV